ncbi:hypothetical protein HKX48_000485 [Thoreauomyces humboldtii]|nr:hypothetical protein HKX48_000485 [Thoreauomyces humboldtii]
MATMPAPEKTTVAAGAAALVQLAELDPMANEKVEAEIPDELKEQPPPEALFAMDKRMEEILVDLKALEQIRQKDYQNTGGRADRLGAFQGIGMFEKYKQIRTERVDRVVKKEMPAKAKSSAKRLMEEVETYWNVDSELDHTALFQMLMEFYKDKSTLIIEQNALLLSRWTRFCRTSHDIANFYPVFQRYQEWLQNEYVDTVERYERLADAYEEEQRRARIEESKAEAERIDRERHGLTVGRKANTKTVTAAPPKHPPGFEADFHAGSEQSEFGSNPLGPEDLGPDPLFNVGDLVVFLRWIITTTAGRKHTEMFLQRAKMFAHSDRVQFIKDYRLICNVKASQGGLETLNILDGINKYHNYIEHAPIKRPRVEDFLTEFDLLVAHWALDTPISREDGRPFAYEVELKFRETFARQVAESSFPPHEGLIGGEFDGSGGTNEPRAGSAGTGSSAANGASTAPPVEAKVSMAALSGLLAHPGYKYPHIPRLLYADWIKDLEIFPEREEWREADLDRLMQLQDVDFELRYEHDIVLMNDVDHITGKLREAAHRIFELAGSLPGSNPGNPASRPASGRPQKPAPRPEGQASDPPPVSIVISGSSSTLKPFELGMKVPDPRDLELPKDFRVLDGKKHAYGILLRSSADSQKVEQEVTGGAGGEAGHGRATNAPTVAALFSEHEILCFLELRLIRVRDLRSTLLSQLNFFRSVEKRLNCDWKRTKARTESDITDPLKGRDRHPDILATSATVTHMWHQQELFDIPDASAERSTSSGTHPGTGSTQSKVDALGTEDIRQIHNGQISVKDYKGVPIIYDAAVDDLKTLEGMLLRLATVFINSGRAFKEGKENNDEASLRELDAERAYGENMRQRISERKAEFIQFVEGRYTFLNPNLDRAQALLELFDQEVKFQFAKIEVVNAYLEIYEHTQDPPQIQRVAQIITDLMHAKPAFDLKASYFSQAYALSTRSLQIHAQVVISMVKNGVDTNREWYKRYFGRIDPTIARQSSEDGLDDEPEPEATGDFITGLKKVIDSPVPAGLPPREDSEKQTVTMHHASVILNMTEIVPTLDAIVELYDIARTTSADMGRVIEELYRQGKALNVGDEKKTRIVCHQSVECAVWKGLYTAWETLSDNRFQIPQPRGRRLVGRIDSEVWMENPLMPDIMLLDHYPRDASRNREQGLKLHVAAMTPFNDPEFRNRGLQICQRLIKVMVLKERLYFSWLATEHWRRTYEAQFPQLNVNKTAYTGRLNSLRFDLPDMADNTAVEDEYEDDPIEGFGEGGANGEGDDDRELAMQATKSFLRFGPLAVAELDENIAAAVITPSPGGPFDFSTVAGINSALRPNGMNQIRFSLRIQLLEKMWHMGAVDLHHLLLAETHCKVLIEGPAAKLDKNKAGGRRSPQRYSEAQTAQVVDVDYRLLVTSIVPRKKSLRKMMLAEYNREFLNRSRSSTDEERDAAMIPIKANLLEWYYGNMLELVQEECERAEYAKLMVEFRNNVLRAPYGKLLFRQSKVKRHFDYFANQDKGVAEADVDPSQLNMDGVTTQEIVFTEGAVATKICRIWALPSVTEVVMSTNSQDKSGKANLDYTQKVFKNSGNFDRAWRIQSMLMDLFTFVSVYAHLLQDNRRYAVQVRQVREADYVVNTLGAMKKDLSYQGMQADIHRVEQYLVGKWQLWILKLKLALGSSTYCISMNLMPIACGLLLENYKQLAQREMPEKVSPFQSLIKLARTDLTTRNTPYPSPFVFSNLDVKAKRICDKKVLELEECLEEFMQATMLNFGENADEINKSQSDFLLTGLKLLASRRKFLEHLIPNGVVHTEAQLTEFFRMYKIKILVPSVRLYHKLGAKGNASIALLLRDEMVTATVDFDFNRIAQALFDKCQVTVLQTELMRECTMNLIRQARSYHDRLADERTGRLFKVYESIDVPSQTGEKGFAFRLGEEDYTAKTGMINELVRDLWKANVAFMKEVQDTQKLSGAKVAKTVAQGAANASINQVLDPLRVFACTKDALSNTITKFALQITKWQAKRRAEQDHFMGTLMGRMLDMIKNGERLVKFLAQEKRELTESYKRDVRLVAFQLSSDLHAELASTSVELADLRKQRRTDERRIRNRILDEYDDLVQELVMEINVLRNRFSEYRVNTFQEVMSIMSEAKKEELHVVLNNAEMPVNMKESARWMIKHEEEAQALRQENHELKMTLLKVRSMYIIKEQALRSMYEKKTRKLSEGSKTAEEKLWDSYREAEARESTLRKQLSKAQKTLSLREAENDTLQRHLREEQQRVRQLTPIKDRAASANVRRHNAGDSDASRIAELQDRLSRYEGLQIETVLKQLEEKTRQVEQLTDEQRKRTGGMAGGMVGGNKSNHSGHRRAVSARLARPPMIIKAVAPRRKGLGPYSEYREYTVPTAEENSLSDPGQRIEKDVNDHLVAKVNTLAMQNKALRNILAECGIEMPEEEEQPIEETESELKKDAAAEVRKSVMWEDQLPAELEEAELEEAPRKTIRSAQSAPPGGRGSRAPSRQEESERRFRPPRQPSSHALSTGSPPEPQIVYSDILAGMSSTPHLRERPSASARGYRTASKTTEGSHSIRESMSMLPPRPASTPNMIIPSNADSYTPFPSW